MSTIITSALSDVGKKRDHNEDNYYAAPLNDNPTITLAIVSDGVGGRDFGEVASQITVDEFALLNQENKLSATADPDMRSAMLDMAARRIHKTIYDTGKEDPRYHGAGMACTLVGLVADAQQVGFVNVGDSRLYHFSNGALVQKSTDHTVTNALLEEGKLTQEQALTHVDRNTLYYCLGLEHVDNPVTPQTGLFDWEQGDTLLLCSDGLTDMVSDQDIADCINSLSGKALVSALVDAANNAGGRDNITVVVLENT